MERSDSVKQKTESTDCTVNFSDDTVRNELKKDFTGYEARVIDELTPEEMEKIIPYLSRIREARVMGILPHATSFRSFKPFTELSTEQFELLKASVGKFPMATIMGLLREPKVLDALKPEDPRYPISHKLLIIPDIGAHIILGNMNSCNKLLEHDDPGAYIDERIQLLDRFKKLHKKEPKFLLAEFMRLSEEKVAFLETIDEESTREIFLQSANLYEENPAAFVARVNLWKRVFTVDILSRVRESQKRFDKNGLNKLVALRASWTESLLDLAGLEGFRASLNDPESVKSFVDAGRGAEIINKLNPDLVKELESRTEISIENDMDDGCDEEVRDILEMSGLLRVLKSCVREIAIVPSQSLQGATGTYGALNGEILLNGQIDSEKKKFFPGTIMHEAGHAVENLLGSKINGQRLFDKYAVEIVYHKVAVSSAYPEALGKIHGKDSGLYLRESFAEDFRIFLQKSDLLPADRKEIFQDMIAEALPQIDISEMREKIRRMYGLLYGLNTTEVQKPTDCADIEDFTRRLDRMDSERKREAQEKTKKELEQKNVEK